MKPNRVLKGSPMLFKRLFLAALICLTLPTLAFAVLAPIRLDGDFADWAALTPLLDDANDDTGLVDFGRVWVANDQDYLYIRFETEGDVQPDEQQDMRLYLDTDMNAGTGTSFGGIGADLVWEFGWRDGTYNGSNIAHDDIGLLVGPTVSSTDFEIAIARSLVAFGSDIRFILYDADSADRAPSTGSLGYTFAAGSDVPPSLALGRDDPDDLRFAAWNVQSDGLFNSSKEAAQGRLLDVMDPDILVVNEVWGHTAAEVRNVIAQHLPSGPGENWYATGDDGGNVIVSRLPILQSWEVNPGYRITAALLDLGPDEDTDLLVIACHWRCCTADNDRQNEADSIIGFLRDARTPGGVLDLPQDTPFILGGDLNLVGWRRQLETILYGDILDEGTYGPDAAPDWDGGDFAQVLPRHPDGRAGYTWRNDGSSFYPGVLDYILFTDSMLDLKNNYVLETRTMTAATRSAYGLGLYDTTDASDHAARVADFSKSTIVSAVPDRGNAPLMARLLPNVPNPFNPSTRIRFEMDEPGQAELAVYDARGHLVRRLDDGPRGAGPHSVTWDGTDRSGRQAASGVYYVRLVVRAAGETVRETRSIVLVE
jgi:hypothetical protein